MHMYLLYFEWADRAQPQYNYRYTILCYRTNAILLLKKIHACILNTCTFIFTTLHEDSLSLPCTSDRP